MLGVSGMAVPAYADVEVLVASLFGFQEVPAVATPGRGLAVVFLDTTTNKINFTLVHDVDGATAAHFHGNGFPGVNAPILINIGNIAGLTSPIVGQTTVTAQQAADLLAGRMYINIHSALNLNGEIRGQVAATNSRPLVISPVTGVLARTEGFDLTLLLRGTGLSVTGGSITLNGIDVTGAFAGCVRLGTLPENGGQTFRCPVPGGILTPGPNFFSAVLNLSDGSSVGNTVLYDVKNNTEP